MKAKMYVTMENSCFAKSELKPISGEMGGVNIIEASQEPDNDEIIGFGVAITGASCYELNTMDKDNRDKFLADIYGKDGLGLSVGRLSVGSSDYSAELYSYADTDCDESLKNFSVDRDKEYIIPMIKEVISVNPDIFLYASSWTPPAWMKTGNSLCGGYMRDKYIDTYADYLLKFVDAYKENGIDIKALTIQNEPETNQEGKMPACLWHPEQEAKCAISLKNKIINDNKDVLVWFYDHNFSGWQRVKWCLDEFTELKDKIDGVAFHYYSGSAEMLDELKKYYPDLKFHFSEGGPRLYDNYATDWCKWASMISKALNHGCRSFCGWNLLLDEYGRPNIGPFFCGGLATLNSQTSELTYSGQYKALKHFSPFIKRGAKVYKSRVLGDGGCMFGYPNIALPLDVCTVKNPDGSLVLELVNHAKDKRQVQYFYNNNWWYIELMPNSVVTVVFED